MSDLPLPGEKKAPARKPMRQRVREAVPPQVWTLDQVFRVAAPYLILAMMGACLLNGGTPNTCASSACQQVKALLPVSPAGASTMPAATSTETPAP